MRDAKNKPFEADVVVSDASTDMRQDWVIFGRSHKSDFAFDLKWFNKCWHASTLSRCCSHASTLTVRMHFAGLERCQRSWCMPWTCLEHSCFSHGRARSPVPFGSFHLDFTFHYLYVCKPCPQGWHACAAWVPFTGLGGRLRDTHPIYMYNIYVCIYIYVIIIYIYTYVYKCCV